MKSLLAFAAVLALFTTPALASEFSTSCYVSGGTAYALVCSDSSFSGSGVGTITAYDASGSQVSSSSSVWVGVVVMGCSTVATASVSSNAVFCSFQAD